MDYTIWINDKKVPVDEQVYRAYWQGHRKERYFVESDQHNHTYYYNALDTEDWNGSDLFSNSDEISIEDTVIRNIEAENIHQALTALTADELYIIQRLYYYDDSLRQLSEKMKVPLSTLHYRHKRILVKLKNMLTR